MVTSRSSIRLGAVVALLSPLLAVLEAAAPAVAQENPNAFDLAAVTLTTGDLEDAGLERYAITGTALYELAADVAFFSSSQDLDPAEVEETLVDAGYVASYGSTQELREEGSDLAEPPLGDVSTAAYLFADAEGAAAAYEVITDESRIRGGDDEEELGIGDEAERTILLNPVDQVYGVRTGQAEVEILRDRLVLVVDLFLYDFEEDADGKPVFEPEALAAQEALAVRLVERADDALAGRSPDLSRFLVEADIDQVTEPYRAYTMIDGDPSQQFSEAEEVYERRVASLREHDVESVLVNEQHLTRPIGDAGEVRLYDTIFSFEGEEGASSYLADVVDILLERPNNLAVDVGDELGLGDESFRVTIEREDPDGARYEIARLYVRVGAAVASITVSQVGQSADAPVVSVEALVPLAEAQVACFEDDGCGGPVPVPAELAEFLGIDVATDDDATADEADGDEPDDPLADFADETRTGPDDASPAAEREEGGRLDLTAIALTTADLADAGLEGYTVVSAGPFGLAADAAFVGESQGLDADEVEEIFADAGHAGSYLHVHDFVGESADPADTPSRRVQTIAYLFADADGAADAYAVIADESRIAEDGGDVADAGTGIGDESELTRLAPRPSVNQAELEVLFGRLVLEVSLFLVDPVGDRAAEAEPEDIEALEALGERLVERAETAIAGDAPDLTRFLVEIESVAPNEPYRTYDLLDGDAIRIEGETEEAFADRAAGQRGRNTTSRLVNEQILSEPSDELPEFRLNGVITAFESDQDAEAYVAEIADLLRERPDVTEVDVEDAPGLGDESQVLELRRVRADGQPFTRLQLFVRVGEMVALLYGEQTEPTIDSPVAPLEALLTLGEAQVMCFEDGGCQGAIPAPDELAELLEAEE